MRFSRARGGRVLVVGIFQSLETGRGVLKDLHRSRLRRAAAIHAPAKGRPRIEEPGISAIRGAVGAAAFGLAWGAFVFWQRGLLTGYSPGGLALLFAVFAVAGALVGWAMVRWLQEHADAASLARCLSTILPGETIVLAEVKASQTSRALAILRDVETEAPVTFAFHPPPPLSFESAAGPLGRESAVESASRGKRGAPRRRDPGRPGSKTARAFLSPSVAQDRAHAGVGERESHNVGRGAPRLYPLGGVAAR